MRVGEHLRVVVDRPARNVFGLEEREPVRTRLLAGDRVDARGEGGLIPAAQRVVGELRLLQSDGHRVRALRLGSEGDFDLRR
jgi:hypothetical protein